MTANNTVYAQSDTFLKRFGPEWVGWTIENQSQYNEMNDWKRTTIHSLLSPQDGFDVSNTLSEYRKDLIDLGKDIGPKRNSFI